MSAAAPAGVAAVASEGEQFALLVSSVREYAIYMIDPSGLIRTWNAGAERIKGYAATEVIGRHFALMFTPEDRVAGRPARLLAAAERDGQVRDEGWRVRKDGTRFWASATITAIRDPGGTLRGFGKVSRDETERHADDERRLRYAEELAATVAERTRALSVQAEELRRVNQELEQFNRILSHDLQEPIRMVVMYLQRLAQHAEGRLDADEQRFIRYASEGAERMRRFIDDLMRYNRLGGEAIHPVALDSGVALRAALDDLAQLIARREAVVACGALPVIRADAGQLTRLFQNLVHNGIKYGPEREPRVTVQAAPDAAGWWRFSVQDNGIGIDPSHHATIFGMFQRLHSSEEYPGTGMGLAICRKIVEQHGGRIWVESAPGAGATFRFTLPAG